MMRERLGKFALPELYREPLRFDTKACHRDCASAHTSPHCAFRSSINLRRS